jgi:site-specific recombinase XerD
VPFAFVIPAWLAIRTYGKKAGLALPAHPHMLQHACGFALADQGADTRLIQDYWTSKHSAYCQIYSQKPSYV